MNRNAPRSRVQLIAPELAPYLQGDETGRLRIPRCRACGTAAWPPRPLCAHCGSEDFATDHIAALGELYSWTTTHRAPAPDFAPLVPYTIVVVALAGPDDIRILGRLHEARHVPALRIGMRMRGVHQPAQDGPALLTWSIDSQ